MKVEAWWDNEGSDEEAEDLDENAEDLDEEAEELDEGDEDLDESDEDDDDENTDKRKGFQRPYDDEDYPGQYQRKQGGRMGSGGSGNPMKPWKKKPPIY